MRVQGREHDLRREPAAVVLTNNASGKTGSEKNRIDCGFPMFDLMRFNVRPESPRHFCGESNALESTRFRFVDEFLNLARFAFRRELSGLTPFSARQKIQTALLGFLFNGNPASLKSISQLLDGLIVGDIN